MKRKDFLKKGLIGLGSALGIISIFGSKEKDQLPKNQDCELSPRETRGPFPNKTPSDYVRENIIGDRKGIPLLIELTVVDHSNSCSPLTNAWVDIWHCDSRGNYSEYGGYGMQRSDLTQKHFLRGRQKTDAEGKVSFVSIFPGFYRGRAPHVHVEILNQEEKSLLATQIAFPEDTCNEVYMTENYDGMNYVSNTSDGIFRNSLAQNMADLVYGSLAKGYHLKKKITVTS